MGFLHSTYRKIIDQWSKKKPRTSFHQHFGWISSPHFVRKKKTPGTSGNPLGIPNGKSFKIPWFQSAPASYGYLDCLGRNKRTYITIIYYRLGSHKSCKPYTIQAIPWPDIVAAVLECTRPAIFQVWVRIWGPKKTLKPSGFGQVITTKRPGIKNIQHD